MAKQTINIGASPNDGTGTPLRTAFQYTNSNFSELYTAVGPSGNNIVVPGNATITGDLTVDTSTLKVDSANDRVGIGIATPAWPLDIRSTTAVAQILSTTGTNAAYLQVSNTGGIFYLGRENSAGTSFASPAYSAVLYAGGAYPLVTTVNGSERYRIASDGVATWSNVGGVAGTAMTLNSTGLGVGVSPAFKIHANGVIGTTNTFGAFTALQTTGGTGYRWTLANDNNFYLQYSPDGFGSTATSRIALDSSGNVGIGVTPSAGKGCLQLSSGINFPATQVASSDANTLDDYEEGTFTPTIVGTTTAGTGTYATQQGRYTKIGNQVSVHIFLDWSAHTGTGNLKLAGLPFQSSNNFHACSIGFWNNIAVTAANVPMAYVINQETNVSLLQMPSGGGAMAGIPMDTAGSFVLSATYTV